MTNLLCVLSIPGQILINATASVCTHADELLSELLGHFRAVIDTSTAAQLIDSIFTSDQDLNQDCIPLLATVLSTLFEDSFVGDHSESIGQSGATLDISAQSLSSLVKLAVKSEAGLLDSVLYHILKHKLCSSSHEDTSADTKLLSKVSNDSITTGIESVMMSLHLGSSGESSTPPSSPDLSLTRLLVTTSDTLIAEKIDRIYSSLSTSCLHNPRANRIFEASETNSKRKYSQSHSHRLGTLSKKKLLKHCVNHISAASAGIMSTIFQTSNSLVDYFDSELFSTLCDQLFAMNTEVGTSSCSSVGQVCVLRVLLGYLEHSEDREGTVNVVAKQLWQVCCDLLSSSESTEVQVC